MKRATDIKLLLLFLLIAVGHIWLAYFTLRPQTAQLFGLFAGLFLLYVLLCRSAVTVQQATWLIAVSLALRGVWLFAFPQLSDDWARFVWDGRLQAAGFNPFNHVPSELMHGGLAGSAVADPALYKAMNSPDYFTIYPPILQGMFAIASKLFPHNIYANIVVLKTFIFFAECGTIFFLVKLCDSWKVSRSKVLLYALNPLIIAELTGNVHHEAVVIFFLVAMLYALQCGRFWIALLLLTAAALTKLVPLIFLPLMVAYFGFRKGLLFCAGVIGMFAICWLPFINAGLLHHATASIGLYFQSFEFNAGLYYLVRDIIYHFTHEIEIEKIAPVLGVISTTLVLAYAFRLRKGFAVAVLPRHFIITLTIYLAFTTMVHPWYITPLIALSVFTRMRFTLVWSAMIVSSYYEYHAVPEIESNLQIWLEYLVVGIAICYDLYRMRLVTKPLTETTISQQIV